MLQEVKFLTLLIIMTTIFIVNTANIPVAGNFNPFFDENQTQILDPSSPNESHPIVNFPSLDAIHDQVHQVLETNETSSHQTHLEKAGPSMDLIDHHPHTHDDELNETAVMDTAKRLLIQPSIDFLEAHLHGGEEHVHDGRNQTDRAAADLNDFQRWLKGQNQTNQLNRFLSLQKEVNRFHFGDGKDLNQKLNRTIEEIKSAVNEKRQSRHEL